MTIFNIVFDEKGGREDIKARMENLSPSFLPALKFYFSSLLLKSPSFFFLSTKQQKRRTYRGN